MRILIIASELPPVTSGVSVSCSQLIESYREAGHDVETLRRSEFPTLSLGEVRLALPMLRSHPLWRRRSEFDVIHLHGPAPTFIDILLLILGTRDRSSAPPVVYTHHFDIDFRGLRFICGLYNHLNRWLARRAADAIVVTSNGYATEFSKHPLVAVIPFAGDHRPLVPGASSSSEGAELKVLFVGQQRSYKGVAVLLQALQGLENVSCTIAGAGPLLERHRELARTLDLAGTNFPGRVDDQELDRLFLESDVVVLPSTTRLEAFGLVLLEGMRYGCIPVASRLCGMAEVVGDAGLLVRPGDMAALRHALEQLRDDPEKRIELSERARSRSATFSWSATGSAYLGLFDALVARSDRGTP